MNVRVRVLWTSIIALACALVGGTLAFGIFSAVFSRLHVVEDYMPTDSGTGYALTRMFPQEGILLSVAGLLVLVGSIVWLAGVLSDMRARP